MKRWRYVIAGLVILCAPAHAQKPVGSPGKSPAVKEQQASKPDSAKPAAQSAPTQIIIVETPKQAAHADERESSSDKHESADLKAQQDAASAAGRAAASAERQEVPAFVQIWLASIGTIIAAIAVVTSILTARRTNQVTVAQLRAYLTPFSDALVNVVVGGRPMVSLFVSNTGQTPAFGVKLTASIFFLHPGEPDALELTHDVLPDPSLRNVGRDRQTGVEIEMNETVTQPMMDELTAGTLILRLNAYGTYRDVFDKDRWIRIRLESARHPTLGFVFVAAAEGNDAN